MFSSWSLRSVALFLTGKSCSSLFTLILKTALSLTLMRFGCFLIHSNYSGTFFFKQIARRTLYSQNRSVRMRTTGGPSVDFKNSRIQETKSRCRVPISTLAAGEGKTLLIARNLRLREHYRKCDNFKSSICQSHNLAYGVHLPRIVLCIILESLKATAILLLAAAQQILNSCEAGWFNRKLRDLQWQKTTLEKLSIKLLHRNGHTK